MSREADKEVDEIVARAINGLVTSGTLTEHDASKASPKSIDDFTLRRGPIRSGPEFLENQEKMRRLFGSELLVGELTDAERKVILDKVKADLRLVIDELHRIYATGSDCETPPQLFGFIILGSLVDPDRKITKDSDLDIIGVGINAGESLVRYVIEILQERGKISFGGLNPDGVHVIKPKEVFRVPTLETKENTDYWRLTENREVMYVGKLPTPEGILTDEAAEAYLRKYLNSPEMKAATEIELKDMETHIKQWSLLNRPKK